MKSIVLLSFETNVSSCDNYNTTIVIVNTIIPILTFFVYNLSYRQSPYRVRGSKERVRVVKGRGRDRCFSGETTKAYWKVKEEGFSLGSVKSLLQTKPSNCQLIEN